MMQTCPTILMLPPPPADDAHLHVTTVRHNFEGYTKKQIQHATRAAA